jgi:hypothetical protein
MVDKVNETGEIGILAAEALSRTGADAMPVLGRKGTGLSDAQTRDIAKFSENTVVLSRQVEKIATILDRNDLK